MITAGTTDNRFEVPHDNGWPVRPDRIRVLQFLTTFALGGTERQVANLALDLDPSCFELHFGCLGRWGELLGEITELGIGVVEYRINKLYNFGAWGERLRFARDLRRKKIEIVHAYNFDANIFAIPAARWAGVPVILASIRGTGADLTPLRRRAEQVVCRLAHRILANGETVRQYLIAVGYDPEKIVVIRNGIDLSRFRGWHGDGRLHYELGLHPRVPLVAVFTRLVRYKGVEHFLEAAALASSRMPDVRFLVVGDGCLAARNGVTVRDTAYREELERYASRLGLNGRVMFTGFRLDVPEILPEIAVSVLPSVQGEGLPNAVLEASAAGVPVVATNVEGSAEAVEDGVTGLLVPPGDSHALARAICQFLEAPEMRVRFGAAGRERIVCHFSLERYVRETEALYSELLTQVGGRCASHTATFHQHVYNQFKIGRSERPASPNRHLF